MTDSIYTIALFIISVGMTVIAGVLAYLYRQRDGQFEAAAKQVNALTNKLELEETLTSRLDESGKSSEETAEYYMTRCEKLQEERDMLRSTIKGLQETQTQLEQIIHDLRAERATLYRRNAKGQIEPITPNPRRPHTLQHGMTVKDPTPQQAKRIFREAMRVGILHHDMKMPDEKHPWIWFAAPEVVSRCLPKPLAMDIYITPTEFIRRIKGEIE